MLCEMEGLFLPLLVPQLPHKELLFLETEHAMPMKFISQYQ